MDTSDFTAHWATWGTVWRSMLSLLAIAALLTLSLPAGIVNAANDGRCNGAFQGTPPGTLAKAAYADAQRTQPLPHGAQVPPGDTIHIEITWNTDDWTSLDALADCVEVDGVLDDSRSVEEKPPVNDGVFFHQYTVPDAAGSTICDRARLSGQPTGGETTQKSNILCFDIVEPAPTADVTAATLAFDCTEGLTVSATNDGDADATLHVFADGTEIDTVTVSAGSSISGVAVEGEDLAEDDTATFTVQFDGTELDSLQVTRDCEKDDNCEGPVKIEVRHAETGVLVTGDAQATFDGSDIDLDTDGETDAGTFDCETDHTATLTAAPDGFVIVGAHDSGTLSDQDDDGQGELLTLILTVDDEPVDEPTEEPTEPERPSEPETPSEPERPSEPETPTEPETPMETETPSEEPVDEPEVGGIVEECEGALEVVVIGPDGSVIDGPVDLNNTEIETTYTDGSVECGTYTVTLDEDALAGGVSLGSVSNTDSPDAAGPVQIVVVEDGDQDRVVFELVQVKGVTVERPPAPAPDTPDQPEPAAQPEPEPVPQVDPVQLARTGADTWWLLTLAAVALLAGTGFLRAADRRERVTP